MSRRLRSVLRITNKQLQPRVQDSIDVTTYRENRQEQQKKHFDKNAKSLAPIVHGERVRNRDFTGRWKPVVVVRKEISPRSFTVRTDDGKCYRQNRRQMKKTQEQVPVKVNIPERQPGNIMRESEEQEVPTSIDSKINQHYTTRSGRQVRPRDIFDL